MQLNLIEVRNGQLGLIGMCWSDENCKAIQISEGSLLGSLTQVPFRDQNCNSAIPIGMSPIGYESRHIIPQFLCRDHAQKMTLR